LLRALQGCVIVALRGCVIVALQSCVIVALQGCVIVALQMGYLERDYERVHLAEKSYWTKIGQKIHCAS
jgi:hypothetical protein